jgi:prepilin-type N-terminal cleavage/methylation domain-containing protein
MSKKGFSLIELIITVAIIGILAAIAIPAYVGQQARAARTEAYTNLQNLRLVEEQFFAERGYYSPCNTAAQATCDSPFVPPLTLGTAGKDHPLNAFDPSDNNKRGLIARGGANANAVDSNDALSGFRPGSDMNFSYWLVSGQRITNAATNPPTVATIAAGDPPCFVAFAQGNTGTRVANATFAIDCNNNRNF